MSRYITTPIYYASGSPHLGHVYTTLVASCLKRYEQLRGVDVMLTSGTDEHGQKIERSAAAVGMAPSTFVAARSAEFRELWDSLSLPLDLFQRTTSEAHRDVAVDLWQRLAASGDIYKGHYEGLYCVECEQYFTAGDRCPVHRKPLETFSEESYFFRLCRYQSRLIEHLRQNPSFVIPDTRRNEVLALLEGNELRDLSISRTSTTWGIPVPGDDTHVMYVWVDALAAYLSALGSLDSPRFNDYWRDAVHCIGKDILTFHAVYWPAILWSAGLPVPQSNIVNGWLTVEGKKISKSDPTTVVDAGELARAVSCDGLQLYFLKTVTLGQDLDFRCDNLLDLVNSDLANTIGNLFSRFLGLVSKHTGANGSYPVASGPLSGQVVERVREFEQAMDQYLLTDAARCFIGIANLINRDIQQVEPWFMGEGDELAGYLASLYCALADLTVVGSVFVPDLMQRARALLGLSEVSLLADIGKSRLVRGLPAEAFEDVVLFPRVVLPHD